MDTGTQARLDLDIKQKIYMILLHQLGTVLSLFILNNSSYFIILYNYFSIKPGILFP